MQSVFPVDFMFSHTHTFSNRVSGISVSQIVSGSCVVDSKLCIVHLEGVIVRALATVAANENNDSHGYYSATRGT